MLVGFKDLGVEPQDDGHPRWAPVAGGGWHMQAPNEFRPTAQNRFWRKVVRILTAAGNGKPISAHCLGLTGLSVGGPGFTGPAATELLGRLYLDNPQEFSDFVNPSLVARGVFLQQRMHLGALRWGFYSVKDEGPDAQPLTGELFWGLERAKSGKWLPKQKALAMGIVEGVGCFLMGCLTEDRLLDFTRDMVEQALNEETRVLLRWPPGGVEGGWYFSREQQQLWTLAACLVLDGRVRIGSDSSGSLFSDYYNTNPEHFFSALWTKTPDRIRKCEELLQNDEEKAAG